MKYRECSACEKYFNKEDRVDITMGIVKDRLEAVAVVTDSHPELVFCWNCLEAVERLVKRMYPEDHTKI